MKIAVVLESGADNELDRAQVDVQDTDEAVDCAVKEVLEGWRLAIGDIIRIERVG